MNEHEDGCFFQIFACILIAVVSFILGDDHGHDNGVRDHAAGRYVVVQMPDGTEQVCKVKEKPDGK